MADKVKVVLLKPLDGLPVGTATEFDKVDADRLRDQQAVRFVIAAPANKMAVAPANKTKA